MNKHYILSLFDDTVKTVGVKFNGLTGRSYTYKTRLALQVEDKIVVETPSNGFQVVDVVRIDDEPDFEIDSVIDYKWVVCKVDTNEYLQAQARDLELHKEIAKVQRRNHREAAKNALATQLPGLANMLGVSRSAPVKPERSSAYLAGKRAGESDELIDNPYPENSVFYAEWRAGFSARFCE